MNALEAKPAPSCAVTIGQIVVAVDLSSHSAATVGYAAQFAQAFGASLTLAHVCPPEPVNPLIVTPEVFTAPERQRAVAQEAVAELAQSVRLTCPHC